MSFFRIGLLVLTLACLLAPCWRVARAQSCHTPSLRDTDDAAFRTSATGIFASYDNASYTGEYQGAQLKAAYLHPRISLELALPYYRLVRNGLSGRGVGDLAADARVVAFGSADQTVSFGPELALTFPTGDAHNDFGMGHVMLMPGAWFELRDERLIMIAQVAYGRSATSLQMSGHHHEAIFPIVNPMNMQELEHALSLGYALHPQVELDARLFGAVPIHAPMGSAREIVACGVRGNLGALDLGVEVQVPVVGAIFHAKTLLSVAAQW